MSARSKRKAGRGARQDEEEEFFSAEEEEEQAESEDDGPSDDGEDQGPKRRQAKRARGAHDPERRVLRRAVAWRAWLALRLPTE
jgi:hypothetical protein